MSLPLDIAHAGLRLGMVLAVLAAMSVLVLRPDPSSPGFVLSLVMLIGSILMITGLMVVLTATHRRNATQLNEEEGTDNDPNIRQS